jgi:hypothetical protein
MMRWADLLGSIIIDNVGYEMALRYDDSMGWECSITGQVFREALGCPYIYYGTDTSADEAIRYATLKLQEEEF